VIDPIVKVLDTVVRDDMTGAVDLHGVLRQQRLREAGQVLPCAPNPTHQARGIIAADKNVVGDIKVARPTPVAEDAAPDAFQPRVFQSKSDGPQDALAAEEEGYVGIADSNPFEVVVIRSRKVEQNSVASAVENDFAVARGLDYDRFFRRAVCSEIKGAVDSVEFGPA
jgi:hypothetical protein